MSEETKPKSAEKTLDAAGESKNTISAVEFQHVIITLADGRRGVFMGPALIKEFEMKLGMVPQLTSIDFDPPRAVSVPVPLETPSVEETPNADQKTDSKPAAGLE